MDDQRVPYAVMQHPSCKPDRYVRLAFEDVRSIGEKAKYIKENGFGGAALYALNADDSFDRCKQGEFPMLRTLDHHLNPQSHQVERPDADYIYNKTSRRSEHKKAAHE